MCHSKTAGASMGLRLDEFAAVLAGSDRGPVAVAGDPEGSEIIRRLSSPRSSNSGPPPIH